MYIHKAYLSSLIIALISVFSSLIANAESSTESSISGAKVINDNCARCHNARPVHEFSLREWSVIMPHMREKAHLTAEETTAVMSFYSSLQQQDKTLRSSSKGSKSGKQLMSQYGCIGCHSFEGEGGSIGPSLDSVVAAKGIEFVTKKLENPQFNNPASPMPRMKLSDVDVAALVDYLSNRD